MLAFETAPLGTARLTLRALTGADVGRLFEVHPDPQAMRDWSAPIWNDEQRGHAMVARDLDPALTDHLRPGIEPTTSAPWWWLKGYRQMVEVRRFIAMAVVGPALMAGVHFHGNVKRAAILPVVARSWLDRLLRRAVLRGPDRMVNRAHRALAPRRARR